MRAERGPQVTSQAGHTEAGAEGFTLIEVVCILAIIAMLAAIVLPAFPRATPLPRIEGYAMEAAVLLNADHSAARRQHREIATLVDARSRVIQSGATGEILQFPKDVKVDALLAERCNDRAAGAAIHYLPSGMSCGGVVALTRGGVGFQVRVNWLTGGAEIVPVH
jgi:general secretion pathway protein H